MLTPLAPTIEAQLAEHHTLIEIARDRAEIIERMASLARQLDALTHRALAIGVDVDQLDQLDALAPPPPAPAHGRPPRKGTRKGRKQAPKRTGPARPKRAPARSIGSDGPSIQDQVLTYLGSREEPATPLEIGEALGVSRYVVDKAIAKCNGQLARVVEGRGPNPSKYLRADQLPADGWPHTKREARAQLVDSEEEAGKVKRQRQGRRATGPILETPPEPDPEPAEAEPEEEVTPDDVEQPSEPAGLAAPTVDLAERALAYLWEHGAMRVAALASELDADPVELARVMRAHQNAGKIRRQQDGAFVAQPVTV